MKNIHKINENIYITSDEEIKDGDWCYQVELNDNKVDKCYDVTLYHTWTNNGVDKTRKFKKIILTTDQDLIKDGVQPIDDEFLEWFVENPSCEFVEWDKDYGYNKSKYYYKIIIPQEEPKQIKCYCGHTITCDCSPLEEPKQETLEEAAKEFVLSHDFSKLTNPNHLANRCFQLGAKWQQERMYSEEDMIGFAEFVATYLDKNRNVNGEMLHAKSKYDGAERTIDLLEQFKKK
jgi:hypothetical protein